MNYATLYSELANDPAGLGYAGKSDVEVAAILNAETQETNRISISGDELIENTGLAELVALGERHTMAYWGLAGKDSINVAAGSNTRAILSALFPAGSTTRDSLATLLQTPVMKSRAAVLGLGKVKPGHVAKARGGD